MSTTAATENTAGQDALRAAARASGFAPARDHFLFLRHGRTPGNIARVYQHPDIPLATEGFADADAAAQAFAKVEFDHICASDMARAWLTAGRVADVTGRPVRLCRALRERYFGDFIGTSSVGLDWRVDPPNGETMLGFIDRTARGVEALLAPGPVPLLVSHGGVLRVLAGALDVDLDEHMTANGAPLEFTRDGARWRVRLLAMPLLFSQQLGAA